MRRLGRSPLASRVASAALAGLVALAAVPRSADAQDFDPRGRTKPGATKPGGSKPGGATAGGTKPGPAPGGLKPAPTGTGEPGTASTAVLLERYAKIVLQQPGSPFPLQRLAQLYRERDGNLTKLVADFEARAAQPGADPYAAVVALAGLYKLDGRSADAIATYEKARALRPGDPSALLALARLLQDTGDLAAARTRYEEALAKQTTPTDREQTLRTLLQLALDAKDWAQAKKNAQELVKLQPSSLFVRGELGRELLQRGEYERAEAELKELVQAAQGDNRTLAPALKDLGRAQAKAHKKTEALATLKRALAAAGAEAAVRTEIWEIVADLYRADQQVGVLVKELEAERPSDFGRLSLLGGLYEEIGDPSGALTAYRKALAANPRHVDLRLKVIRLLQAQGELDKAIAEYEALIRAAPNNPAFVLEQCEALLQRGDRARALRLLAELERRGATDEDSLARLADFYGRIGESEKSLAVLQRLTSVASNDPGHLVDLGDRYFQDGNKQLAVQTWRRILTTVQPRARALSALGDVLLEHEMLADALAALREAVQLEPQTVGYKKQLATALERTRAYKDARQIWQELDARAKKDRDKLLAREARTRIVTLWGFERVLEAQVDPLRARFRGTPPDVDAGRTLAEVELHLRRLGDAEATLRRVTELAPGDAEAFVALERVLVQAGKLDQAIAVLEKLVAVEPKRARELYQRMAQYALQIYKDEDAIRYAARAVELNPDDAEGHRRLGDMYRSRQDTERAILEYRAAITRNDRLFVVFLDLADLLLSKGQTEEADRLYRRVLRGAPDEELVARAARLSMQINLGRGTLESLERELLPLAIGNPQRKIYRRVLVDIYGSLAFPLVQRVRHGAGDEQAAARQELARIGARAVKPLLDALADGDAGQQRTAIEVLAYVENRNAAQPLFAYATGPADTALRTRAMLACGNLREPAMLGRWEALLFPKDGSGQSDQVATAAAWAVARLGDRRAGPLLKRIAQTGSPSMRAYAVLGLAQLKDRSALPLVTELARSLDAGTTARAAAAWALGELGEGEGADVLVGLATGDAPLPRALAVLALGRAGAARGEVPGGRGGLAAVTEALVAGEDDGAHGVGDLVPRAAAAALAATTTRRRELAGSSALPLPDETQDTEAALAELVPHAPPEPERLRTFVTHLDAITRAAQTGLATSDARARAVLEALTGEGRRFEPLGLTEATKGAAEPLARLERALEPDVIGLARHPDPAVRTRALRLLARATSDQADDAVARAVGDPQESVQRVALAAVGAHATPKLVAAVGRVVRSHTSWAVRIVALEALGRLGRQAGARHDGPRADVVKELREAVGREPYALAREAALVELASFAPEAARPVAERLAASDPEPRVRERASRMLEARPAR